MRSSPPSSQITRIGSRHTGPITQAYSPKGRARFPAAPTQSLVIVHALSAEDVARLARTGLSLREPLVHSAAHETTRSAITSLLAGDVYRPAMWHSFLREGFTRNVSEQGRGGREPRRTS